MIRSSVMKGGAVGERVPSRKSTKIREFRTSYKNDLRPPLNPGLRSMNASWPGC